MANVDDKAETIVKNDFIELRFTGRVKGGEIFDTNIPEDARKIGLELNESNESNKPYIICIGHGMILPKIDNFLIGKEAGKGYTLEISPDEGFGHRRKEFMKVLSMEIFRKQDMKPQAGMVFTFDGMPARISAVSGGRVTVDFNNPLAGKELVYELNIIRKADDLNEKIKSLIMFFFRSNVNFRLDEKDKKVILDLDAKFRTFLEAFSGKFKEILGMDIVIEEAKPEEKKEKKEKKEERESKEKEVKETKEVKK